MKKLNILALMALFISLFSVSCSSDDDETLDNVDPIIEMMEPHAAEIYEAGSQLHVNAMLSDNVDLSSFKIDIHHGGDGHTHDRSAKEMVHEIEWDYEMIESISGSEYEVDVLITIPEQIMHDGEMHDIMHGEYHVGLFAIDASGNDTEAFVTVEVEGHDHDHGDDHDHD